MLWVPGVVYFAVSVVLVEEKEREEREKQMNKNLEEPQPEKVEAIVPQKCEEQGQNKIPQIIVKKSHE